MPGNKEPLYMRLDIEARKLMAQKLEECAIMSPFDTEGYIPIESAKQGSLESLQYVCFWLKQVGIVSADQLEEMAKYYEKQARVRA